MREIVGNAYVGPIEDKTLTGVDFGAGSAKRILGLDANGNIDVRVGFSKDEADALYEAQTFDYSTTESTVTRSTQGTNTFLIITQSSNAGNTPIGLNNKI